VVKREQAGTGFFSVNHTVKMLVRDAQNPCRLALGYLALPLFVDV
jgi:hypothetical protein